MGCGVKLGLDDRGGEGFLGDANCLTSPWENVLCQKGSCALSCQRFAAPQGWVLRGGIGCNLLGSLAKKATLGVVLGAALAGTLLAWQVEEKGLNEPAC